MTFSLDVCLSPQDDYYNDCDPLTFISPLYQVENLSCPKLIVFVHVSILMVAFNSKHHCVKVQSPTELLASGGFFHPLPHRK